LLNNSLDVNLLSSLKVLKRNKDSKGGYMCECALESIKPSFTASLKTSGISLNKNNASEVSFGLRARLNYVPESFSKRLMSWAQTATRIEAVAEIIDEGFHVTEKIIQSLGKPQIYEYFSNIHVGAHCLESGLHAFAFVWDFARIAAGKFWVYLPKQPQEAIRNIDFLRSTGRVCQFASHFFATINFAQTLELISLGKWANLFRYGGLALSTVGFTTWTVSLLWNRLIKGKREKHFTSDLIIQMGGALFSGLPLVNRVTNLTSIAPKLGEGLSYLSSFAGIAHASAIAYRVWPSSEVRIRGTFNGVVNNNVIQEQEMTFEDHHHHH
jgi:hypothetical protein